MTLQLQKGFTIPPQAEAVLYAAGLIVVYLSTYNPTGAPPEVQSLFGLLGSIAIIVKFELTMQNKPQITTHQALYSVIAVTLNVVGGLISKNYGAYWYGGFALAVIGSVLATYEDLGGKVPTLPPPPLVPPAHQV